MTPRQVKKTGCANCPHHCEPREGFPLGTCLEAIGWVHGLHKMESCPIQDEKEWNELNAG